MEPWLALVLLLTLILNILKVIHSRDFTEQDITHLHDSSTPFPGGFKCFTCEDAQDNFECNRWAPDVYCPYEAKYCYTRHTINEGGESMSVTKRCVAVEDCLLTGCTDSDHEGNKVCIACCEGNICNLPLPWNQTDAILTTALTLSSTVGLLQSHALTVTLIICSSFISCAV